jgi:uncharacterized protein
MFSEKPRQQDQQLSNSKFSQGKFSQGNWWAWVLLGCGLLVVMSVGVTAKPTNPQMPKQTDKQTGQPTTAPTLQPPTPALPLQAQQLPLTAYTVINNNRIDIEVAQTPEQQEIGLMFRKSIAPNRGMLFPFSPSRPVSFWMKNCLMPLDMVFIRSERVIAIAAKVPPCRQDPCPTYGPKAPVDNVLELAAGRAASLGLRVGDTITFNPLPSNR